jgi:hypothetical protein
LCLDQSSCDCQAEPRPAGGSCNVGSPEAIEHPSRGLGRDAFAGVLDADTDFVRRGRDDDRDGTVRGRVPQRVGEEVQKDSLDLVRRATRRRRVVEVGGQGDIAPLGFGP